jgi:tetratricopeptide (TPR) repeat protein
MGTPGYMPPEQARGDSKDVDERSDLYSIGAVLYELLTGQPPFSGGTDIDTILKVLNEEPANPRKLDPGISKDLETICLKAMEKDKARRYQSAQELIDDLRRFQAGDPITARPVSTVHRIRMKMAKHKAITAVVSIAVICLLVGVAVLIKKQNELEKEKQKKPEIVKVTTPDQPKSRWQELVSANFDDGKAGNWKSAGKNWTVKDGRLVGIEAGELNDNELTAEADLHGNFEVEFDILPDGKNPGVFSFFFLRNADRTTGYELQIYLNQNGIFLLQKSIRENLGNTKMLLEAGPHRLKICKTVNEFRLWIDKVEQPAILAFDPSPITDPANLQYGFAVSKGTASLDNIVVRGDSPEYRTSLLAAADKVLQGGYGKYALEMYNEFICASTDENLKAEAKYKLALCLANAPANEQDPAKIEEAFKRVVKEHPGTFFANEAERRLALGAEGLASTATPDPGAMFEAFGQAAALLQSGGVKIEMSNSPDAEEEIDIRIAAAQNESSKLSLFFQKGYILLAQYKYKEAAACFDKVVQNTGSDRESRSIQGGALLSLAYCHYQLEDFAAAEKCYRKMADRLKDLIEKFKKDGLKLLLRTMNMQKEEDKIAKGDGSWEEKAKKIEENRREMAGPFEALTQAAAAKSGLAMTLANLGRFEEALKEADGLTLEAFIPEIGKMQDSPLKIALGSTQGDSVSILKARILLRAGKYEEAAKEAQRVLPKPLQPGKKRDLHEGNIVLEAYQLLFFAQVMQGDYEEARRQCERVLKNLNITAWNPTFESRLAYLDIFTGQYEQAKKRLEDLASREPNDIGAGLHKKMAFLVSNDEEPDPAAFLPNTPATAQAYVGLFAGMRFELNGKPKEAIAAYKKAMEASTGTDDPYCLAASRIKTLEKRK